MLDILKGLQRWNLLQPDTSRQRPSRPHLVRISASNLRTPLKCRATTHLARCCIFLVTLCCLCPLFCLSCLALVLLLLLLLALLGVPLLLALQLRELLLLPWQHRTHLSQVTPAIMKRLPRLTIQITLSLTDPILQRQACCLRTTNPARST